MNPIWWWRCRRFFIGWFIPLVWLPVIWFGPGGPKESKCAYVILLMSSYWFSEVIPMAIASLIPVVLLPLFGILSSDQVVKSYMDGSIMVLLGSLIAATAVQKSNLHQRIALRIALFTGTSPKRLLLGFMCTTALLSMMVSLVASAALMIPIVQAALEQMFPEQHPKRDKMEPGQRKTRNGIFLGVCYAANIGSIGTSTGGPVNLVLNSFLKEDAISYSNWLFMNLPGVILLNFLTWCFICYFMLDSDSNSKTDIENDAVTEDLQNRYRRLGRLTFHELAVLILFGLLVTLCFFRAPDFMPGWINLFIEDNQILYIKDSAPTMLVVILFFLIPADIGNLEQSPMLLDWNSAQKGVSWSVLLLLGGGLTMARGCIDSGLSQLISDQLTGLQTLPYWAIMTIMCIAASLLTELISNPATCSILIPVIFQLTSSVGIHPIAIGLPVTISCSFAFLFPFSCGPTALIYEASGMKTSEMIVPGFCVKIICILGLLIINQTYWKFFFFDFLNSISSNTTATM